MTDFDYSIIEFEPEDLDMYPQDTSLPQYVISGSGWGWFLDPESHQMVRVARGSEIVPLPATEEEMENNKILVRASYRFLLIDSGEVQEVGWNQMKSKKTQSALLADDNNALPSEISGWKVGDVAWAKTYATQKTIYGEIVEIHPFENPGPTVSILDASNGKYMTVLVSSLSEKQPRRTSKKSLQAFSFIGHRQ